MIKNIVFDFGNVLVRFAPVEFIMSFGVEKAQARIISRYIYSGSEWTDGDHGLCTRAETVERLLNGWTGDKALLANILSHHEEQLQMRPDTPTLLRGLKAQGYRVFCISNTNPNDYAWITARYPVLTEFEGSIISYREKLIKPSPEIFRLLLDRYQLNAEECVFLDDMPANTAAAEKEGFKTILVPGTDELRHVLFEQMEKWGQPLEPIPGL